MSKGNQFIVKRSFLFQYVLAIVTAGVTTHSIRVGYPSIKDQYEYKVPTIVDFHMKLYR